MKSADFIALVAKVAVEDWGKRKIMLPSVVIAQAILESGWGESELALKAMALFGIKKNGWTGKVYVKDAAEQKADGSYITQKATEWRAYDSWNESILDHNDYIATREKSKGVLRYAAIIGNGNYKEVCQLLKECGYSTSLTYPEKLLNLIEKYNLAQYDTLDKESEKTMGKLKVAIDAGHGLKTSGKRCSKSLDKNETREWFLNDRIADRLEKLLAAYNCEVLRVDDTTGNKDISLAERVRKANEWGADIYISVHHNAGLNGKSGGGTIVYYYSSKAERAEQAKALYNAVVAKTGLAGDRSQKVVKHGYYVIKNTKMAAFLLENGFMDSSTDVPIILTKEHADKTAQGLLSFIVSEYKLTKVQGDTSNDDASNNTGESFKVRVLVDALNIRAGADTCYAVKGCIRDKGVYTIVETCGNWGKLKSGIGWISLHSKYVKRV